MAGVFSHAHGVRILAGQPRLSGHGHCTVRHNDPRDAVSYRLIRRSRRHPARSVLRLSALQICPARSPLRPERSRLVIAFSAFRTGLVRAFHMPRIVLFAWLVNLAFGLILAVPMLQKLDGAIRGTVMEEPLLERMDENWVQTFKTDNETSEIVTMLDYSILGYAPFLRHSEVVMSGGIVRPLERSLSEDRIVQ